MPDNDLTVLQLADAFDIRLDFAYRLLEQGRLPGAVKMYGRWRVPLATVEARVARIAARHRSLKMFRENPRP